MVPTNDITMSSDFVLGLSTEKRYLQAVDVDFCPPGIPNSPQGCIFQNLSAHISNYVEKKISDFYLILHFSPTYLATFKIIMTTVIAMMRTTPPNVPVIIQTWSWRSKLSALTSR